MGPDADGSDGDGPGGDGPGAHEPDEPDEPDESEDVVTVSTVEQVVMAVSLALTVALFGFAVWHALAGASTVSPVANVTDAQDGPGNRTDYTVTLWNEGNAGLVSVTVGVECPGRSRTVTFRNVPAGGHRNATVRCPATAAVPSAEVTSWIAE